MIGLPILLGTALALMIVLLSAMLAREMRRPPRHSTAYALAKGLPCDPGELNPPLPFEEWWLDRPDGAQLPVWDIRNPKSPIQNPEFVAVLIHGWGHSRIDVLPRIQLFLPFCDRIIMYDLRGHGESRNASSRLGNREDDDLLALLERLGDSRVLLVGHSMGATIAIKAAAEVQRRNLPVVNQIAAIIVYGPYCEFHRSLQGRLVVAGYPARPITDMALLLHRLFGLTPLSLRESDMELVRCPILMIHGSDDQVAPVEHGQRLAAAARNATLHVIEGAAHIDAHTIDAARHDELVTTFLRQIVNETLDETNHPTHSPQWVRRASVPPQ
jgi:pimeloyl-ACP methyl ester carboxylesterase